MVSAPYDGFITAQSYGTNAGSGVVLTINDTITYKSIVSAYGELSITTPFHKGDKISISQLILNAYICFYEKRTYVNR